MNPPHASGAPESPDAPTADGFAGTRTSEPRPSRLPPEATGPRSISALALDWLADNPPVGRRTGPRAELAYLRAELRSADASGDVQREERAAAALSRALAAGGAELDTATKLARRALVLGEDRGLREELSAWFAGLGEAGLAAATLRPLVESLSGKELAQVLVRIAVFHGRTGDAVGAADALAHAVRSDPSDPIAAELRGAIAAWSPAAVPRHESAQMYLEGAARREANDDRAGAFEDVLRAFDMAPESAVATERLASGLAGRGRLNAADEVRREHGEALGEGGRAAHEARVNSAVREGDLARALGAAFDAGWDLELDVEATIAAVSAPRREATDAVDSFDALLLRAGLNDLVAARLEVAADALSGPVRARALLALGNLCAGPIASTERAVDAWIEALTNDPTSEPIKAVLREYGASTGDFAPLIEGLVRVGSTADAALERARVSCLRELSVLAEQRLGDATLALWALKRAAAEDVEETGYVESELRLKQRAKLQDESLASARSSLSQASGQARLDPLRLAAAALKGRPDSADELTATLREIIRLAPEERGWRAMLERVLARGARYEDLANLWQVDLQKRGASARGERNRLGLAWLHRRAGRTDEAIDVLEPLLNESTPARMGLCVLLCLATQAGRHDVRARALLKLGGLLGDSMHAVLASVVANLWVAVGDAHEARRAAEEACRADASIVRPICTFASVAGESRDRVAALVFERAIGAVVPRGRLCDALAQTFDELGESGKALEWTQRWLALRPGDSQAIAALLGRVTAAGDAQRLGDALAWLLAQPRPLVEFAPLLRAAITRLAEVDTTRGTAIARRALDVFGPRVAELRDAVLAVADAVNERGLAIAIIERQLASGAPGVNRADTLIDLARRRREAADADGSARALVRALAEGANPAIILDEIDVALPPRTSDGDVCLLEARAEALSASAVANLEGTAYAWRQYGGALWDLASDRAGAIRAWEHAVALDPEKGIERFARDLVAFGGHSGAVHELRAFAEKKKEPKEIAFVLARAAGVALDGKFISEALTLAVLSLEKDPSRADVLAIAERAAGPAELDRLERAYDLVAAGVLGIYGERAAHYRAARQLERRGERRRALRHAILAFEAVPAEGVTFVLMMRLAERVGESEDVVRAIERVASMQPDLESRATWLRRAALVAGDSEEGKRQRVDVLLRALDANPEGETLRSLGLALEDLLRAVPDERESLVLRFERALDRMLPRLRGPDGARVAIEAAALSLTVFEAAALAFLSLGQAARVDASVDEYATLMEEVPLLTFDRTAAESLIDSVRELAAAQYSNLGEALFELAVTLAEALPDSRRAARLLVTFAKKHLDDETAFARAEMAALQLGDATLLRELAAAVPPEQRAEKLFDIARAAADNGRVDDAARALEEVRRLSGVELSSRERAENDLRSLYRRSGRSSELERLLKELLDREELTAEARLEATRELASLYVQLNRRQDAHRILSDALEEHEGSRPLLDDALRLARQMEDTAWQVDILARLVELQTEPAARVQVLRKLASLLDSEGAQQEGARRWSEIREIDPSDTTAVVALVRDAERRADWERVIGLLESQAQMAPGSDESRELRLKRADVIEAHLGRPDEARSALEAMLDDAGDHLGVLTRLADLNERLGDRLRAAPLWLRASGLAADKATAGHHARRACDAYLHGGDVESATRVLSELSAHPQTPELLALRVEIARRNEDPAALAAALEEQALSSMDPPKQRAALLVEAARAALLAENLPLALGQAQRAARLAPEAAEPQLFARLLEYRHRRAGTEEQAYTTTIDLQKIQEELSPEQAELRVFLIAEAFDVIDPADQGLRWLTQVHAEHGSRPLIALGLAERLAIGEEPERSLPLFDAALEGDLRGLRKRGEVALAAARAADNAGDSDRALLYLEVAAALPESRAKALEAQAALRALFAGVNAPPRFDTGELIGELSERPSRRTTLGIFDEPALGANQLVPTDALDLGDFDSANPPPLVEPFSPSTPEDVAPARRSVSSLPDVDQPEPEIRMADEAPLSEEPPSTPRARSDPPPSEELPQTAESVRSSFPPPFPPVSDEERGLLKALSQGSIQAGKDLMESLEGNTERTQDLVNVCRRVALLLPGDWWVLGKLHAATLADRNLVYARAIEHVLHAFDAEADPIEAPPLEDQIEQPERVQAMLFREARSPATEALGLVWTHAQHIFRRDPSSYGITGLERINPGAPTPLAHLYASASRLLGLTRTPLFQRRSGERVTVNVALLSPPAIIVSGEVRSQTPDVAYHLGAMLAATLPEQVLLYGAPEAQAQSVLRALRAAFGPPQSTRGHLASVATLAEMLWESVPSRSQRRLRELCDEPAPMEYDTALSSARQAVRRAGLFISGDLTVAVRESCADFGISTRGLAAPGGLAALCAASPAVADLVRLATSPQYADARWRPKRGSGQHPSPSF